jgi:hypothetical protein
LSLGRPSVVDLVTGCVVDHVVDDERDDAMRVVVTRARFVDITV